MIDTWYINALITVIFIVISINELDRLSELREHSNIPIAVDESLTDLKSAYKIINKKAADVFIIKPMLSGGYKESKRIYNLAKQENIDFQTNHHYVY